MAYSYQEATSDGSLVNLLLSIEYFSEDEITVEVGGVPNGIPWVWGAGSQIVFQSPVPAGVLVRVYRTTDIAVPRHDYTGGAAFTASTLDENLTQVLRIAQEAKEGGWGESTSDLRADLAGVNGAQFVGFTDPSVGVTNVGAVLSDLRGAADSPVSGGLSVLLRSAGTTLKATLNSVASWILSTFHGFSFGASTPRTVASKLRETVSALDFGADNTGATDCYAAMDAAWQHCLATGSNLYIPAGVYSVKSEVNFPFGRIDGMPPVSLLDCKDITVYGDGPATVLRTDTIGGADVLQFNGAKNLHVRGLALRASITGTGAGSNGVSVTGGYDNITLRDIWCYDLPSLDKVTHVDGGKALTIQTPVAGQTLTCGKLVARGIYAKGCVYGFGIEVDLVASSTMPTSVDVEVVAEDCRQAVAFSAGQATSALSPSWAMGLRVRAQSINCMQDVVLSRAHGADVECQVTTTKPDAARILNYAGVPWFSTDSVGDVVGLTCAYAHSASVRIFGHKGACAYKARVGGSGAGASGLTGATWRSTVTVGLSGAASVADFGAVDSGGNVTASCVLTASGATAAPSAPHYAPGNGNAIVVGNTQTLQDLRVQGAVRFTYTDGSTSYAEMGYDDESITFKQGLGSSGGVRPVRVLSHSGATLFAVRNDGMLSLAGRGTATNVATLKGVLPIYDESNNLWGYVPVYTTYTP